MTTIIIENQSGELNKQFTMLNFPSKAELKNKHNFYETNEKLIPEVDFSLIASAFISWVHRMSGEEEVSLDLYTTSYHPISISFSTDTTVDDILEKVTEALSKKGLQSPSHDLLVSQNVDINHQASIALLLTSTGFKLAGLEAIINSSYENRYLTCLANLIVDISNNANQYVLDLNMLTSEEFHLWKQLNSRKKEYPKGEVFHQIFSKTASEYLSKKAISTYDDSISFIDLEHRSNMVANGLIAKGVKRGDRLAVFMDRSIDMIVAMLGVMKAGAVYVPLSLDNPKERNNYIVQDIQGKFLITSSLYSNRLEEFEETNVELFFIDHLNTSSSKPEVDMSPNDIAYIIYTSGSTGKPKGVQVSHRSIVGFGYSMLDDLAITSNDVIGQFNAMSFDASFLEVCPMIFTGAQVYILTKEERLDVSAFSKAIERQGISYTTAFPVGIVKQYALYASEEEVEVFRKYLKVFGAGGASFSGEVARLFQNKFIDVPFANIYGPTEATVSASVNIVRDTVPEHCVNIPIGKPLTNYEFYVVNERNQLAPIGVEGELLIATDYLADGYLNLPDKTAQSFFKFRYSDKLAYHTGDSAKLLEDGTIELIGRRDNQVKVRGYRIELGEVEDKFLGIEEVETGAVVVKELDGENTLVAYYKVKEGASLTSKTILDELKNKLAKYMLPTHFIELEEMPLSPNSKIDRNYLTKLPLDVETSSTEMVSPCKGGKPINSIEKRLAEVWQETLHINNIGREDHFFEIGGHSLKVLEMLTKLKKDFPMLKINDFFKYPTIKELATVIEEEQNKTDETEQLNSFEQLKVTELYEHPKKLSTSLPTKLNKQSDILLTGATGYLGAHILIDLLKYSDVTIYPLVRASSILEGHHRIKETLDHFTSNDFYTKYNVQNRINILLGDFTKEDLGLSQKDMEIVQSKVNAIIHCGADVRHFGSEEEFKKTNIFSTKNLLRLAKKLSNARFHFISTIGIPEDLALKGHWDNFLEQQDIANAPKVSNLYTNSKLESEKLIEQYYKEGLPVTIFRPGNVSCQADTGIFQKNIDSNAVYRMLKSFILFGKAPNVDYNLDFTMVDYASRAITHILLLDDAVGGVYHICNPVNVPYKEVIAALNTYGYSIDLIPQQQFESFLYSDEDKDAEGLALAIAGLEGDGAKDSPLSYHCPNTLDMLKGSDIVCPLPNEAFIHRMLDYAVKIGYFNKPSNENA